jgi:hypothetical protein
VTSEVSAPETSTTETIKRIGPALVLTSALGSTLGIIIAQFLDDLGDGILALILGAEKADLFNNRVEFTGASDLAWAGGFVLCLLVGLIMLFSYPTARGHGVARLTMLWTLLHILRQAFFQAAVLPFDSESQLALAYEELDAIAGLDLVVAAAGGVGLLLIALSAASAFLVFAPQHKLINTGRKRLTFALWIALIPAVASAFLAIPFFLPVSSEVVRSLPWTAVIFIATLAAAPGTTTVQGPEDHRQTSWPWGLLGTLLVVLVFELVVLDGGVAVNPLEWGQ